jgi:diguanylate cyclase (GGDEF)-like protein
MIALCSHGLSINYIFYFYAIFNKVSNQMQETKIDPTSGFLDRFSCLEITSDLVSRASESEQSLAVIWLDLDRFKQINESFGYEGGDNIISLVSDRLREKIADRGESGRIAADEFIFIVEVTDIDQAESLALELMRAIEPPISMGDFRIRLTASVGIALLEPEETAAELLERADWSKNTAKKQGGNRHIISGNELIPSHMGIIQAREDLEVEYLLHTALENGGLQLHYQPILGFNGKVLSVEALMRCTVNGKSIPPGRFFPVAEKSGLIVRLGEWSLLQGTRQAKLLSQLGLQTTVSINVSRGQLADVRFAQALQAAVILADVSPALIELEFSESIFMDASETIQGNLRLARELGVSLAIDNFGTGFSCMANIKDIPASKLKLGRSLTLALPDDRRSYSVVKAMVNLGKDLGLTVIAEGVETKEQMEDLKSLSIDGIQGYYYARPMDDKALSTWLTERERQ